MRSLLLFLALVGFFVSSPGRADDLSPLVKELEEILESDQSLRVAIREKEESEGVDSAAVSELWKRQAELDAQNIKRLREIVATHRWPRISVVGEKAAMAAFLVVQHAEPAEQAEFLPMLRAEAERGEVKRSSLALLEDRVRTSNGQPQIYGSQLRRNPDTGKLEFLPIEDAENVNVRRAEVGLESIEQYARRFGLEYVPGTDG